MSQKISPAAVSSLSATLLIPLWAKAVEFAHPAPLLRDAQAQRMLDLIDFDFSIFASAKASQAGCCARAALLDEYARAFLDQHPDAVVVHVGAGLDARYERLGRPSVTAWYELDLPPVIELRRQLLPESGNVYLAGSMLDEDWMDIAAAHGKPVLLVTEGVVMYFGAATMRDWFARLARKLPQAHLVFDVLPKMLVGKQKQHDSLKKLGQTPPEFKWGVADVAELADFGLEVLAHKHLSSRCRKRYPLPMRLAFLSGWCRRHMDMQMVWARFRNAAGHPN
ncbi:class I SAM-dependent methyltransferase [Allofranklinella schreckenbergeri]|uniref:Class I SAM-dependent methyltransferase n=1 Tax=Allofranklinella schreckenbergeri TaxID=1076744 RepID=A0A3M6QW29_9BURK|nr:class I SAM-dependent methyltransferase [Allofranklinella schreckenbergeri]RMX07225.1 class I SAM-dependent methyltransferase [Allofranklinella schreckenbergeri]